VYSLGSSASGINETILSKKLGSGVLGSTQAGRGGVSIFFRNLIPRTVFPLLFFVVVVSKRRGKLRLYLMSRTSGNVAFSDCFPGENRWRSCRTTGGSSVGTLLKGRKIREVSQP
jgi:hypothetical protein